MLSTAAFNALLKILEEPPAHLMFILATTELHKVPATIKSRCQQFSFQRILPADIARRLSYVAEREGIDLKPEGAALLAPSPAGPWGSSGYWTPWDWQAVWRPGA